MKILNQYSTLVSAIFLLAINTSIFASEVGGSVVVEYKYDDNILKDQNQIIDAKILVVAPELSWLIESSNNSYEFIIDGEIGEYEGSNEDNYSDTGFSALGNFELNSRHRLSLLGSIVNDHNDRGTNFSQGRGGQQSEVDEFTTNGLEATYSFGRKAAAGKIDFSVAINDIDYDERFDTNGFDLTAVRDRKSTRLAVDFTYRMTAKTNYVANISTNEVDYDSGVGLSNTENLLSMGLSWQGTAKTIGTARIGYRDRTLDNGDLDSSGSTWAIGILWSPLSYSTLNFTTDKSPQESIGIGDFRIVTSSGVSWNHEWTSRISSNISFEFSETDFEGTNLTDETTSYQASLDYQLKDRLGLRFSYISTERDSNDTDLAFIYDREIVSLSLVVDFNE